MAFPPELGFGLDSIATVQSSFLSGEVKPAFGAGSSASGSSQQRNGWVLNRELSQSFESLCTGFEDRRSQTGDSRSVAVNPNPLRHQDSWAQGDETSFQAVLRQPPATGPKVRDTRGHSHYYAAMGSGIDNKTIPEEAIRQRERGRDRYISAWGGTGANPIPCTSTANSDGSEGRPVAAESYISHALSEPGSFGTSACDGNKRAGDTAPYAITAGTVRNNRSGGLFTRTRRPEKEVKSAWREWLRGSEKDPSKARPYKAAANNTYVLCWACKENSWTTSFDTA
ncbi:hypothetical protein QFC20_004353 [Naganishia adeliensis]|uniref:Uncharacterized protein n=1 Tax=Naganishia adeliensis TaxID=92952 RepID=A0ACC2W0L1_9TREE|nr:hypothetical protein QFC20_004353 [Naganishia adeliensis]